MPTSDGCLKKKFFFQINIDSSLLVNPLIDKYAKMQHQNKNLDKAVKQKNNRDAMPLG
jgi:hypothetical protein